MIKVLTEPFTAGLQEVKIDFFAQCIVVGFFKIFSYF